MKPKLIFSDFDGTLTLGHDLSVDFFSLLQWCNANDCPLIINTGRSLQWGLFFLTHFSSLKFVIVEGGGVVLEKKGEQIVRHVVVSGHDPERLQQTINQLKKDFPDLRLSDDSCGRFVDRAYERPNHPEDLQKVSRRLQELDIPHLVSNVHLNFWTGEMSKARASEWVLKHCLPTIQKHECLFFGDSQNDESMFAEFPWTVGVSNIEKSLKSLSVRPSYILEGPENAGIRGVLNYLSTLGKD